MSKRIEHVGCVTIPRPNLGKSLNIGAMVWANLVPFFARDRYTRNSEIITKYLCAFSRLVLQEDYPQGAVRNFYLYIS